MESPNTSSQAVELNPSCLGQSHPNKPGTGPGHKNTESGRSFTVLRILFIICPLRSADDKSGKVFQKIPRSWHKKDVRKSRNQYFKAAPTWIISFEQIASGPGALPGLKCWRAVVNSLSEKLSEIFPGFGVIALQRSNTSCQVEMTYGQQPRISRF